VNSQWITTLAFMLTAAVVSPSAAPALTAMDYVEIQQLVARYGYALDTAADKGRAYAGLFTADGTFKAKLSQPYEIKGRDQLAAFAIGDLTHRGPFHVRDYVTNHIINPSPEGASGSVYLVWIEVEENGRPGAIKGGGRYDDIYVKTPAGWRIKSRTFIPSRVGPREP
jgi:SnoaL-like domain